MGTRYPYSIFFICSRAQCNKERRQDKQYNIICFFPSFPSSHGRSLFGVGAEGKPPAEASAVVHWPGPDARSGRGRRSLAFATLNGDDHLFFVVGPSRK